MALSGTDKGSYFLIDVGEVFGVRSLPEVRNLSEKALKAGHRFLVFDMRTCSHMDSRAVGFLSGLWQRCDEAGGKVGMLGPLDEIKEVVYVTIMDSMVKIYSSEHDIVEEAKALSNKDRYKR